MGRRAMYFTREERLAARRVQRAIRDSKPGAKERRQKQNRQAWRRKREKELLQVDPPTVPEAVHRQAKVEMSDLDHRNIYRQFAEGRESIELGEVELGWDEFNMLIGAPPYPSKVTSGLDFGKEWPILRSALHGVMAYRYLAYCDDMIRRCQRPTITAGRLRAGLNTTFHELVAEHNKLIASARQLMEQRDNVGITLANQNIAWISRLIIDTLQDMVILRDGSGSLLRTLAERKWEVFCT
ncbi:hypothetical protein NMY22_g15707 [Coprinellus aureogranulatus]|nr:hypothetical protein NMY22_g15707 [Coprinellus aureogranulatus]